MKRNETVGFLIQHLVAAGVSFGVFVVVPVIVVVASMIIGNDPGGPMFFPIFVVMCIFGAAVSCVVLILVSVVLQLIRRKLAFAWWVPIIAAGPLSFAVLLVTWYCRATEAFSGKDLGACLVISLATTLVFAVYWLPLCASDGLVRWIRRRRESAQPKVRQVSSEAAPSASPDEPST